MSTSQPAPNTQARFQDPQSAHGSQPTPTEPSVPTNPGHQLADPAPSGGLAVTTPNQPDLANYEDESQYEVGQRARRTASQLRADPNYAIQHAARVIGRTIESWRSLRKIINDGYSWNRTFNSDHYTPAQNRNHELYDQIVKKIPQIPDVIRARGPQGVTDVANLLDRGRSAARNEDTNNVKTNIPNWRSFNPPITLKSSRGRRSTDCMRLLRPVDLDFEDPTVQDGLMRGDDRYAPGPKHFPAFLWPEGEPGHQDDFYGGFMRGDLIFKAALCILYGPTAALRPDGVSEGRRDSIAEIYGIDEVTPALLAYLAMQVRFALDSQGTFGAGDSKKPKTARSGWPLREFYYHILDFIERKMPRTDHQALLDWWNARLFGEGINDAPANGGDLVGHAAPDTAELMLAQARDRERRHSEETDEIRRLDSEPGPSGAGSSAAT